MSENFDALLKARETHFADDTEHELWLVRTLDGLAVGLDCRSCRWEWWRPGYEPEHPRYEVTPAPSPVSPKEQ